MRKRENKNCCSVPFCSVPTQRVIETSQKKAKKLKNKAAKIQQKIVYVIYERTVWIRKKIECLELRKFNGKLCTLYTYEISGLAK